VARAGGVLLEGECPNWGVNLEYKSSSCSTSTLLRKQIVALIR
jgi:hypothetical protein